jgi:aminoglycoside phosphotransferase (APT) family kinase protein
VDPLHRADGGADPRRAGERPAGSRLARSEPRGPDAASPAVWRDALAGIGREPPVREPAFVHGDFQHFNLLFRRGDVSGVLDWGAAGRGPAELDVGHCRLNIAVLFSAELAEQLREAYEAETGRRLVPAWDVHALLSYSGAWRRFIPVQVAGRVPVDGAGMTARVEALLRAALRRRG